MVFLIFHYFATNSSPGHEFLEGSNEITGRTCPWNTFALWSVEHLAIAGFPPVGDGFGTTRENGGVEVTQLRVWISLILNAGLVCLTHCVYSHILLGI